MSTAEGANVNDVDVVSIAMSPAEASSIPNLSAVEATDVILNGRNAGICSMLILPEVVNCTRADGTASVSYTHLTLPTNREV